MKKSITATTTLLIMTCFAYAGEVNFGNYFSIDIPNSWNVTRSGAHVHAPANYEVYGAEAPDRHIVMGVYVLNHPVEETNGISFEAYSNWTEADMPLVAQVNQVTGYTLPVVKKIDVNGIPILLRKQKATNGSGVLRLDLELWVNEKHFVVLFFYNRSNYQIVNRLIDSMKRGTPPLALPPAPDGLAGEV
jgi:hypothetical protein